MAEEFVKINGYEVSKDYKSVFENASSSQLYKVAGGDTKITEEEIKKFNITTKTSEDDLSVLIENNGKIPENSSNDNSDANNNTSANNANSNSSLKEKIDKNANLDTYKTLKGPYLKKLVAQEEKDCSVMDKYLSKTDAAVDKYISEGANTALRGYDSSEYKSSDIATEHAPEHGVDSWTCDWENWLKETTEPAIEDAKSLVASLNSTSTPEDFKNVFQELGTIAYGLEEAKTNTQVWTAFSEAGISDFEIWWVGHGWTKELLVRLNNNLDEVTALRETADKVVIDIVDETAREANGKIGNILKDDFKFNSIEDIDVGQISQDTQNLVKYQDKLQPYVDLCIQYGISCDSLYNGLDKLFEGETGAHDYAQSYVDSFAETAKKEVTGDTVGDTFDMSKFAEELGTLSEDVEANGLNSSKITSLIKSTAAANQKESDEKASDAKKKKTGSSSTGNGSGQTSTSSAARTTASNVSSPVGTVANTMGQAQNATATGQAVQGATGSGYTINTSAWDDAADSLTDDAQQDINTYAQALQGIASDSVDELEAATEDARAVLGELQEVAGGLDLSGVSSGISGLEDQEQGLVDKEAQTATEQAAGTTSGTQASAIMGELSGHGQTYQGYGMDTTQVQQSLEQIKANQEAYINLTAQNIQMQIPNITTSEQAKQMLNSINEIIQDNTGFDTSALTQVQGQLNAKYQELYNKEQQEIKNQTFVQTVTPQVDSFKSSAETTKALGDINTLLQQSQGLDTSALEQLAQTINAKHQTLVQKEQEDVKIQTYVQNTTPAVETLTEASQAFSMLSSANILLQEGQSLGADTTQLELLIQKLNTKYQELMQKETNPTDGQTSSNINTTNNTKKEPVENPNETRPLDDDNNENKPVTISLTSGQDDEEDDDFTFSLTSPGESNSSNDNSGENGSSPISLTSNSGDKKSADDKDTKNSNTETRPVSTKSEDKTISTDKAKPEDEAMPADNTSSNNTVKPEDGVKPTDETKSADEVTSSNSSEVAKSETVAATVNPPEDEATNKAKDEDLEIIIDE